MKTAFALANATEIVIIVGIVLGIRLSTHPLVPIVPNPDVPVIEIPYPEMTQPPSISIEPVAPGPAERQPTVEMQTGVPLPVPDPQATEPTMPSQNQLAVSNLDDPRLQNRDNVNFRIVPVPSPEPAKSDSEKAFIPGPKDYVKTIRKPEVVSVPTPEYPSACRVIGLTGRTSIHMLLDLDGSVMETRVARSSGNSAFDSAAIAAGRKAKFTPALGAHGRPVHVWVAQDFVFTLDH
jgi:protein TonB